MLRHFVLTPYIKKYRKPASCQEEATSVLLAVVISLNDEFAFITDLGGHHCGWNRRTRRLYKCSHC